jgi:transposase
MTCWRRLEHWTEAGVFDQVHQILLTKLNAANRIDWTRAAMDGSHIDVKKGRRSRPIAGQPRQARLEALPDLRRQRHPDLRADQRSERARHQPRSRPARLLPARTEACRERGTEPIIAKPKTPNLKGLGKLRYVVEQSFALLHQFRRLAVRWERRLVIHDGLVSVACAMICWRRLIKWTSPRSC